MEKINIAELLKDCPRGMELYSPIFGEVYLDKIRPHLGIVVTTDKEQGDFKEEFLYDGRYGMKGECMLFPSKGKTTWEGFQRPFKDGDILVSKAKQPFIFQSFNSNNGCCSYCGIDAALQFRLHSDDWAYVDFLRFATEEEKQKLFQAIKDNGYKWNAETKTLEKLPKFKVGDRVAEKNGITKPFTISQVGDGYYYSHGQNTVGIMRIEDQDNYELVPNKFDITTLKPFDKVLARDTDNSMWIATLFSHLRGMTFYTAGGWYNQCIPFEGNDHLIGKTDNCIDFYKNWE